MRKHLRQRRLKRGLRLHRHRVHRKQPRNRTKRRSLKKRLVHVIQCRRRLSMVCGCGRSDRHSLLVELLDSLSIRRTHLVTSLLLLRVEFGRLSTSGTTWTPVFDSEGSYSIGAIALDPKESIDCLGWHWREQQSAQCFVWQRRLPI